MQAGLGGASTTAHRAAELPFVLGATSSLHSSSCIHWPAASTASCSPQGSGAGLQGALGFKQVFWGNLIPRSAAPHCVVPAGALSPAQGPSLAMDTTGREKPWCDISMEPQFLQPCCTSSELKQSWSSWMLLLSPGRRWRGNGARQRHLSHGTMSTATAEKPRQAGLWEFCSFPHQEKMVGDV